MSRILIRVAVDGPWFVVRRCQVALPSRASGSGVATLATPTSAAGRTTSPGGVEEPPAGGSGSGPIGPKGATGRIVSGGVNTSGAT